MSNRCTLTIVIVINELLHEYNEIQLPFDLGSGRGLKINPNTMKERILTTPLKGRFAEKA